jgi:hypothetical protein
LTRDWIKNPATNTNAKYVAIIPPGDIKLSVMIATGAETRTLTKQLNSPTKANRANPPGINVSCISSFSCLGLNALYRNVRPISPREIQRRRKNLPLNGE